MGQTTPTAATRVVASPEPADQSVRPVPAYNRIADTLPALVAYIDQHHHYRDVNSAYERWFGLKPEAVVGRHMREILGELAYQAVLPYVTQALAGQTANFEKSLTYQRGGARHVDATYVPVRAEDGTVRGFTLLVNDVTERKRREAVHEDEALRGQQLMSITAALAEAVTAAEVHHAVVDAVSLAVGASSAGLWTTSEDGQTAHLVHLLGYSEETRRHLRTLDLRSHPGMPVIECLRTGTPVWIPTQAALLARFPHLTGLVTPGRNYSIASLPLQVRGRTAGALALTFDDGRDLNTRQQDFLLLISRYSAQAMERLRLFEAERQSRARVEVLHELAAAAIAAERMEDVFEAALDAIAQALGAERSSILTFDAQGAMRFRAWRNLSDGYRAAVDGHSPWKKDVVAPQPVLVNDTEQDPGMEPYRPIFQAEGIRALGFIPLVASGRLVGKFMVYYAQPRELSPEELALAQSIAGHVAATLVRFEALAELRKTVRFNELFAGILGHDLRNPLGAILTGAQLVLAKGPQADMVRPLSRIVSSSQRMARMIEQLLDFTRIRVGGGMRVQPRAADLGRVLRQVMDELDHPDRALTLEPSGDPQGRWDEDRLQQVFSNLIGNAVEHGEGAQVRVVLDGKDPARVRVQVHSRGAIPAELLPTIFDPLTGRERARGQPQGLGLGLFITQQIIRGHGGEVSLQSTQQTGTVFEVSLPRHS